MGHRVKFGDARTVQWQLNADLSGATSARVLVSELPGRTALIDRTGAIVDAANGIVSLDLETTDYDPSGPLFPGMELYVEVEISPGPVTFPDCGHEELHICYDLG